MELLRAPFPIVLLSMFVLGYLAVPLITWGPKARNLGVHIPPDSTKKAIKGVLLFGGVGACCALMLWLGINRFPPYAAEAIGADGGARAIGESGVRGLPSPIVSYVCGSFCFSVVLYWVRYLVRQRGSSEGA